MVSKPTELSEMVFAATRVEKPTSFDFVSALSKMSSPGLLRCPQCSCELAVSLSAVQVRDEKKEEVKKEEGPPVGVVLRSDEDGRIDISTLPVRGTTLILGKRACGKSTLAAHIVKVHADKFDSIFVVDGAPNGSSSVMNALQGHPKCPKTVLTVDNFKNAFDMVTAHQEQHPAHHVLFVFDHVSYDKSFMNSQEMKDIAFNGRHKRIASIITAQYMQHISPSLRANVDTFFAFKEGSRVDRQKTWVNFGGAFTRAEAFYEFFDKCTQSYGTFVACPANQRSIPLYYSFTA